jgi:hypothetical protein
MQPSVANSHTGFYVYYKKKTETPAKNHKITLERERESNSILYDSNINGSFFFEYVL